MIQCRSTREVSQLPGPQTDDAETWIEQRRDEERRERDEVKQSGAAQESRVVSADQDAIQRERALGYIWSQSPGAVPATEFTQ